MLKVDMTVQYQDANGKAQYLTVESEPIPTEKLDAQVHEATDILLEYGLCPEVKEGHYVFIPSHAIHRVDFQVVKETDK